MRAMTFSRHGDTSVIEAQDLSVPEPADGEVLVRVKACSLNHLDLWVRKGLPARIPMPHIGGSDIAGIVEKLGPGAHGVVVGQRVVVSPALSCGQCDWCTRGDDSLCPDFKVVGFQTQGGLAEFTVARARDLIPISDAWSFAEWSAVPLVFLTAWHMLFRQAKLQPGEDVLVQAAGSGVGSAAIQIAKLAGARVIATAGSAAKLNLALELGADFVVNYSTGSFAKEVRTFTGGRGVNVVVEHVGESVWKESLSCLARGGRLVTCGATTGPVVSIDLRFVFSRQLSIVGAYMGGRHELLEVLRLVEQRRLRPVIDRIFPLADAAAAQQRMERREQFGKVVLQP